MGIDFLGTKSTPFIAILLIVGLMACENREYKDLTGELSTLPLELPEAEYRAVAWIDDSHLSFVYRKDEFGDLNADRRIGLFNLRTSQWRDLPLPPLPDGCFPKPSGVDYVQTLPNGSVGFIQQCHGNSL